MDLGLSGKVAIVTGASRGIGYATAHLLVREGARVAICARGQGALHQAAQQIRAETGGTLLPIRADTSQSDDVRRLLSETVEQYGALHILVNNAGTNVRGHLETLPEEAWKDSLHTKLFGFMRLIREAAPHMRAAGWGRVVNVIGQAGKHPLPSAIAAGATNAGVLALTKAVSDEVARDGILVNAVCPSRIDTHLAAEIWREEAARRSMTPDQVREEMIRTVPMGRYGHPEEVANVIVFLASERASFVSGTTVDVDGGYQRYIV